MTGTGTQADPYIITDIDDLQAVSDDLDAYYELGNDIDASATSSWNGGLGFLPIGLWVNHGADEPTGPAIGCSGTYWKQTPFTGHFDGKGYDIADLTIHRTRYTGTTTTCPDYFYVGLFSDIGGGGVIQNVTLTDVDIDGYGEVGALVGNGETGGGEITNCHASGTVDSDGGIETGGLIGYAYESLTVMHCSSSADVSASGTLAQDVGGLIGEIADSTVTHCFATGDVSGKKQMGGLIGTINTVTITQSYSTGAVDSITGSSGYIGGLVGRSGDSIIRDCYSTSAVTATGVDDIGGLIGYAWGTLEVEDCYATGAVSGDDEVGGFFGYLVEGPTTVHQCYATGTVTATGSYVGGFGGDTDNSCLFTISQCYATGDVSGDNEVGGFSGSFYGTMSNCFATGDVTELTGYAGGLIGYIGACCVIDNCYSTGAVSSTGGNTGGLIGYGTGTTTDSFWDTDTSGQDTSTGGTGKTTTEMQTPETFTDVEWDFVYIWDIDSDINDGYAFFLTSATQSPELESLLFYYLPTPVAISSWIFNIQATEDDAEEIITAFETLRDTNTLVVFYPSGDSDKDSFNVKLTSMPLRFWCENQATREGYITVEVQEIFKG